jgi:DnaJ-class molecular chaperone
MSEAPEVYVACEACGGEGHTLHSRYGGNDPDVWTVPCSACNGTGGVICEASGDPRLADRKSKT